jgi:hypothetical protein
LVPSTLPWRPPGEGKIEASTQTVMPRACGVSSTLRLFGSIVGVSGILDRPLEPVIGLAEAETRWRPMTTKSVGACAVDELPRIQFSNSQAQIRLRDPAARCVRVVRETSAQKEGAGNAGRPVHPQPRVRNVESTRVSHHRSTRTARHSRTQWF